MQNSYSVALYGHAGQVGRDALVFWANLASDLNVSLNAFKQTGICTFQSEPPAHPFFIAHDVEVNQESLVWIRHPVPHRPVPNHSWAEVTHCARTGLQGALWAYYAPGSGMSLNVGRTLVLSGRYQANAILSSLQ